MGAATIPTADGRRERPTTRSTAAARGFLRRRETATTAGAGWTGCPGAGRAVAGLRGPALRPAAAAAAGRAAARSDRAPGPRRRLTAGRVVKWLAIALLGWLAALRRALHALRPDPARRPGGQVGPQLDPGPYPLTARTRSSCSARTRAPRAWPSPAPAARAARTRSCCCGSAAAPTPRSRSRATPSSRSPAMARTRSTPPTRSAGRRSRPQTVKQFLGIEVNHVVEVSFENFPQLIDALGGVTYKGGCVHSKINGGRRNGGTTLRLKRGETEINGKQALALARTRKNLCKPNEDDLDASAAPAAARRGDEGQGHVVRDVHPPALGLVGGAAGRALGHVRPDAARRRRRDRSPAAPASSACSSRRAA